MVRLVILTMMIAGLFQVSLTAATAEDYRLAGTVVVYRSNRAIRGVLVEVKDRKDRTRVLTSANTDDSGKYELTVPDKYEELDLTYTPNNLQEYGTHERYLWNTQPDMTLDTAGLANLNAPSDDETQAIAAARGAAAYVAAGGDPNIARTVLTSASRNFSNFGRLLEQNPELRQRLQRSGLPYEF